MGSKVFVAGVGMTHFSRPSEGAKYEVIGPQACRAALEDAGIGYGDIEQAYAGYIFGPQNCGQRVLYELGLSGIPIFNVSNACATGSSALYLARQAVASGVAECVLAVGFEEMTPGPLKGVPGERRAAPLQAHGRVVRDKYGTSDAPPATQWFGAAAREYMERYSTRPETFAMIAVKARQHAAGNPFAAFRDALSVEEVLASPMMYAPLTRLQCCPPTSGAAAAVVCSESFAKKHVRGEPIEICAQAMTTDYPGAFADSPVKMNGFDMTLAAADLVYAEAGIGPTDIDVVELHDCFTSNELITYEALHLAEEGMAEKLVWDRDNTFGGRFVTNPSGGLLSKGHPIGATGLAQCAELVWQLRGTAEGRQVEGARVALQQNLGLGGACVVTLYRK